MATIEERLAIVEHELISLEETVNSGPHVPWERSVRGRLHEVEQFQRAAENLAQAARDIRRSQSRTWSRREKIALVCFAAITTATPYVLITLHLTTSHG